MRRVASLVVGIIWTTIAGTAQAPVSLIVNGDFEEGPAVGTFVNVPGGATTIPGWVVVGEGIDVVGVRYYLASTGVKSLDLDGSAGSRITPPHVQGGIAQTFATVAGQRYVVTFDMAGNPARPPARKPMRVSAAGQSAEFVFDISGKTGRNMGWLRKEFSFTAAESTTTLEFRSLTVSPLTGYGAAIDNVRVTTTAAAPALDVRETETGIEVALGAEVLFETGQHVLKPEAASALRALADLLRRHPDRLTLIEGHTDSVGQPQANQTLSAQRAAAVRTWLITQAGIPAGRMTALGRGETAPVAPNDTADGRQKNRRVNVTLQQPRK